MPCQEFLSMTHEEETKNVRKQKGVNIQDSDERTGNIYYFVSCIMHVTFR
jgi:hypothetical protein